MIRRCLRRMTLATVVCTLAAVIGSQRGPLHRGTPVNVSLEEAPQVVPEPEPWMIFASSLLPVVAFAVRKRKK